MFGSSLSLVSSGLGSETSSTENLAKDKSKKAKVNKLLWFTVSMMSYHVVSCHFAKPPPQKNLAKDKFEKAKVRKLL